MILDSIDMVAGLITVVEIWHYTELQKFRVTTYDRFRRTGVCAGQAAA